MHLLVAAPSQVLPAFVHTQPERSVEDEELAGQVPAHVVCTPPETAIGVAWNVPLAHAVHTMSDDTPPAVA